MTGGLEGCVLGVNWHHRPGPCIPDPVKALAAFDDDEHFLFVDVFEPEPAVKLVDPVRREIRFAALDAFPRDAAISLAEWLGRREKGQASRTTFGFDYLTWRQAKQVAGL